MPAMPVIQSMVKKGADHQPESTRVERDPFDDEVFFCRPANLELNPEQAAAFARVCAAIEVSIGGPLRRREGWGRFGRIAGRAKPLFAAWRHGQAGKTGKFTCKPFQLVLDRGDVRRSCLVAGDLFDAADGGAFSRGRFANGRITRWRCCIPISL